MNNGQVDLSDAQVLIVDDAPANLDLLYQALQKEGLTILAAPSGEAALDIFARARPDLVLLDVVMPGLNGFETCRRLKASEATRDLPVIFITANHDPAGLVEGFRAGGVDYVTKPFQADEVRLRVRTHLRIHRLTKALTERNQALSGALEKLQQETGRREHAEAELQTVDSQLSLISEREAERWGIKGFVGQTKTVGKILQKIRRLQNFDNTNVLIIGESGTGKELIARAIHFGSARAKRSFVPVNASAIPHELAESFLFGHMRGAFTGATVDRKGYFEIADGGTIFLDEIGDMPPMLQAKLLRVLEDGTFTPIGSTVEKKVNVRIISATNVDLPKRISSEAFREDLFYRLAGFAVVAPPLRERREDIPLLAEHLLGLFAEEMGLDKPAISTAAMTRLVAYDFPGNVRELKNIMARALIESSSAEIWPDHLVLGMSGEQSAAPESKTLAPAGKQNTVPACSDAKSDSCFARITQNGESFWSVVHAPFLERELNRKQVQAIIERGLRQTDGSYKELQRLFGIADEHYFKFMDFLRHNRLKPGCRP